MPNGLRLKRMISKVLYVIFFLVIPVVIINHYYGLFETYSKTALKVTGGTVSALLILYVFFRNSIRKWFKGLAPGWFKKILYSIYKAVPLFILFLMAEAAVDEALKFVRTLEYCGLSFLLAFIVEAFENDFDQEWSEIKLLKRQDKYRSKYNL